MPTRHWRQLLGKLCCRLQSRHSIRGFSTKCHTAAQLQQPTLLLAHAGIRACPTNLDDSASKYTVCSSANGQPDGEETVAPTATSDRQCKRDVSTAASSSNGGISGSSLVILIAAVVGGLALLLVIAFLVRRKRRERVKPEWSPSKHLQSGTGTTVSTTTRLSVDFEMQLWNVDKGASGDNGNNGNGGCGGISGVAIAPPSPQLSSSSTTGVIAEEAPDRSKEKWDQGDVNNNNKTHDENNTDDIDPSQPLRQPVGYLQISTEDTLGGSVGFADDE